jgi:hypothetical protein
MWRSQLLALTVALIGLQLSAQTMAADAADAAQAAAGAESSVPIGAADAPGDPRAVEWRAVADACKAIGEVRCMCYTLCTAVVATHAGAPTPPPFLRTSQHATSGAWQASSCALATTVR